MGQVITELLGGLGNQMFQYAIGRTLALYQGSELLMDLRALEAPGAHTPRRYGLDAFDIRARRAQAEDLQRFRGRSIAEAGPRYMDGVTQIEGDTYLRGYWQSERYFRAARPVLKRDFALKRPPAERNAELAEAMLADDTVAVHFRRGDYVSLPQAAAHHGQCSMKYYQQALSLLAERHGELRVFAFSDEPDWVADNFARAPGVAQLNIVRGNEALPHEDIWLMQHCRHHVIANSSFSWWGAWLGQMPDSSVIAPQRWVLKPGFDTSDVVPQNWTRLAA